jgi:hypothetical protein
MISAYDMNHLQEIMILKLFIESSSLVFLKKSPATKVNFKFL